MKKKKMPELRCSGCGVKPPEDGLAESGWYTVIRAWRGGTTTYVYCPVCHTFQYGPQTKELGQSGSTWH